MTKGSLYTTSGLVFLSMRDIDIVEVGNRVSRAIELLQQRIMQVRITSEARAELRTGTHEIFLSLHSDQPIRGLRVAANVFLAVAVNARAPEDADATTKADIIAAYLLRTLNKMLMADFLTWGAERKPIKGRDFMQATSALEDPGRLIAITAPLEQILEPKPRRKKTRQAAALQSIEDCRNRLDLELVQASAWCHAAEDQIGVRHALRDLNEVAEAEAPVPRAPKDGYDISEATPILRLSAWFMSMAVALLCLPLGCILVIINLLRGENLRLASQAAALTGTFISLQTFGAMAQAAEAVQMVIG